MSCSLLLSRGGCKMAVKGKLDDPSEPWDSRPAIISDELPTHEVKIENLECDFNLLLKS